MTHSSFDVLLLPILLALFQICVVVESTTLKNVTHHHKVSYVLIRVHSFFYLLP